MALTLSVNMAAATTGFATQPGWLLEIDDGAMRLSSLGNLPDAMGVPWLGADFAVEGLEQAGNLAAGGRVKLLDADGAFTAAALNGELSDVPARLWSVDRGALAPGDPVLAFEGSLDNPRVDPEKGEMSIDLVAAAPEALKSPRLKIGPATGITVQIPAGTTLRVGNTTITVEDPRQ